LQERLKNINLFPGTITGSYDEPTTEAVKSFQSNNNLIITGTVDNDTWEKLATANAPFDQAFANIVGPSVLNRETIKFGSTGPAVAELQLILREFGFYNGEIDSRFGSSTEIAVKYFQTNNKLTADGIVGRNTWSALIYLYSPLAVCGGNQFVGVVIDSGHGGTDPGASGNGIIEKEMNLKISQYMANRFRELGIPFAMTRNSDETLTNTERLTRMKSPFGDVENALVISNHNNAGGGEGAETIFALRNKPTLAQNILTAIGNTGQKTRSAYQKTLPNDATKDYYYIMRDTQRLQVTIVEYAFLDNASDALRLRYNWDKYAEATVKSVAEYMGFSYRPPGTPLETEGIYTVVAGDTLFSIANRFNTTVEAIKTANKLTSNIISIGQQLRIPGLTTITPPSTGVKVYTVKPGDTLFSIARAKNTTVEAIKALNNLTSDLLTIGQQLFIPGEETITPQPIIHVVQRGDTLFSLANRFNTTVANLKAWNKLTSDFLSIGQELIVGNPPSTYRIHTVIAGDTLFSIANRFNTTINAIMALNNMTNTTLSIGQQLLIPN